MTATSHPEVANLNITISLLSCSLLSSRSRSKLDCPLRRSCDNMVQVTFSVHGSTTKRYNTLDRRQDTGNEACTLSCVYKAKGGHSLLRGNREQQTLTASATSLSSMIHESSRTSPSASLSLPASAEPCLAVVLGTLG